MTAGGKREPRYGFGDSVMPTACHGPAEAANLTVPFPCLLADRTSGVAFAEQTHRRARRDRRAGGTTPIRGSRVRCVQRSSISPALLSALPRGLAHYSLAKHVALWG